MRKSKADPADARNQDAFPALFPVLPAGRGGAANQVRAEYIRTAPRAADETEARDLASSIAQKRSQDFTDFLGSGQKGEASPDHPVTDSASILVN